MSKTNEMPLNDAIDGFLKRFRIQHKMWEADIIHNWQDIVGKTISKHTTGLYFKDRILFITVDSAPLKQELIYLKKNILEILNKKFEESVVEDIVIR